MSDGNDTTKLSLGFFLGGLISAVTLFFLGTREGQKAGRSFEKKGKQFLTLLSDVISELEVQEKTHTESIKKHEHDIQKKAQSTFQTVSAHQTQKIHPTLTYIEELQKRGRGTTERLRKTLFRNVPKK